MRLTKEMKRDLALQLTGKAISKNVGPLKKRLKSVNDRYWADHTSAVERILPVPRKQWPELMIAGVLRTTTRRTLTSPGEKHRVASAEIEGRGQAGSAVRDDIWRLGEMSGISHYFNDRYSARTFQAEAGGSVPYLEDMEHLHKGNPLIGELNNLQRDVTLLIEAAEEFWAKATALLSACSTKAQLQHVLPEAAALLPEPEKKSNIVPAELAMSVQGMLNKGVPPSV